MGKDLLFERLKDLEDLQGYVDLCLHLPGNVKKIGIEIANAKEVAQVSLTSGIPLPEDAYLLGGYHKLSEYLALNKFSSEWNKSISWPDDGKQPDEGWYFVLSFPCGAYSFVPYNGSGDYPTETFNTFFEELKSYGPNHCDTANHTLYFRIDHENVPILYKDFGQIFNKHGSEVKGELDRQRVKELERELEKLKSGVGDGES